MIHALLIGENIFTNQQRVSCKHNITKYRNAMQTLKTQSNREIVAL